MLSRGELLWPVISSLEFHKLVHGEIEEVNEPHTESHCGKSEVNSSDTVAHRAHLQTNFDSRAVVTCASTQVFT